MKKQDDIIELVKEYIPDHRQLIKLDDLVVTELRKVLSLTSVEHFPVEAVNFSPEEFANRLSKGVCVAMERKPGKCLLHILVIGIPERTQTTLRHGL